MKIVTLVENTACRDDVAHGHGLSQYIETAGGHKILFDMGPNAALMGNAEALGVDLAAVDTAVLSHGHYDHAGGLAAFLERNGAARVYLSRLALGEFYAVDPGREPEYIGVPAGARRFVDRFILTGEETAIDGELRLFSDVRTADYRSHANDKLREKRDGDYPMDAFLHEQNLLITESGKAALFAGCAHRGIVNILRRAEELLGRAPDAVFGGFHLYNPGTGEPEPRELIEAVGKELADRRGTVYYTGHCTGPDAFAVLKERLGDRLLAMSGGTVYTV